mgnify:CR=1 FL=1|tara:strand:+ start:2090 stop:2380 length:291 start_codon:yes stop_codon:yes gene_type:complete
MNLTLEIIESYGFEKTTNKLDWDDVQNNYTLSNGLELSCLTVYGNEPTKCDSLEGLDGFIYITKKEQLDDLNSKTFEQICKEIAKVNDDFDIEEYI